MRIMSEKKRKSIESVAAEMAADELEGARAHQEKSAAWENDLDGITLLLDRLRNEFGPLKIGKATYEPDLGGSLSVYGVYRPGEADACGLVKIEGDEVALLLRHTGNKAVVAETLDFRTVDLDRVWRWVFGKTVRPDSPENRLEILEFLALGCREERS